MACLECDTPGYFSNDGLCRRCRVECLGVEEHPPHRPGYCKGYDCGRLATANDHYCYDCQDELDSYSDYLDSEDFDADTI